MAFSPVPCRAQASAAMEACRCLKGRFTFALSRVLRTSPADSTEKGCSPNAVQSLAGPKLMYASSRAGP